MTIKELYQKSLDRGVIASDMTEDTFREKISTEEGLKSYYDFATQKKGLRFHPFDVFKERIGWNNEFSAAANAHVEQRNSIPSVEDSLPMQPMKLNPSVKDHPVPTNEQEYMQNLLNQVTSDEGIPSQAAIDYANRVRQEAMQPTQQGLSAEDLVVKARNNGNQPNPNDPFNSLTPEQQKEQVAKDKAMHQQLQAQLAQEAHNAQYLNKDGKPKDSYIKDLGESFMAGTGELAMTPYKAIYALDEITHELEAKILGKTIGVDYAKRGLASEIADFLGGEYLGSRVEHYKKEADRYQDSKGVLDSVIEGEFGDAAGKAVLGTIQSAPNLAASIYTGTKGASTLGGAFLGASAALTKWEELSDRDDLNLAQKAMTCFGAFVAECVPETIGAARYAGMFNKLPLDKVTKEINKEVLTNWQKFLSSKVMRGIGKGFDKVMDWFGEGITEAMTEVSNLYIEKAFGVRDEITAQDWRAVGDAFVIGELSDMPVQVVGAVGKAQNKSALTNQIASDSRLTKFCSDRGITPDALADIANRVQYGEEVSGADRALFDDLVGYMSRNAQMRIRIDDMAKENNMDTQSVLYGLSYASNKMGITPDEAMDLLGRDQLSMTDEDNARLDRLRGLAIEGATAYGNVLSQMDNQAKEVGGKVANKSNNYVYEVSFADGSLDESSSAFIVDGNIVTTEVNGNVIIDNALSDKSVFVRVLHGDGSEEVKQVSIDELNLIGVPATIQEFTSQYKQELISAAEQEFVAAQVTQDVVGEGNATNLKAEGEQASNIEGRVFTNGQQTITASNPDSNGNVTLSSPITLEDGRVATIIPQDMLGGVMSAMGFAEQGNPQPQGQQPQAPVVWSEMDANQATATVVERSKGDKARAKKFAEAQVKVKQKALTDAQKELDKVAETEDIDAFNAAQDKVDAIQAEVDKWTAVANGIDAYNAPIQEAIQPAQSVQEQPSASDNVVVTEEVAAEQNTPEGANKITRESVRELLSKEAKAMEEAWNQNEEMGNTDATEIAHDIFNVLGANVHSMMREEIDDYVGEYYPTQATISSETNSENGKKEREQLKNDKNLKALEDAVKEKQAELDAIVEETRKKIQEIGSSPNATAQDIAELLEALARYESSIFHLNEQSGSMSNYDMLDKYIGTTKAFQKDVKMLYDRKNAMANASAKVKEVIELADKATEVVSDKGKFAEAYKRKEDALNALTLEELEQLKDVLRITGKNDFLYQDAENRAASIREDQRRQKRANSLSDIFDNGGTQVDRPAKVKPYKYNPFDFATNDPVRPVMGTAYHEDGHVVSTDAHILVAVKQKYDKNLEGKMTDKDGKVVLESSKFPNWKLVFDGAKTNKADVTAISVDDFRSFLEGAKAKLKAEWQAKKDNGEKVGSFKDYLYNKADVMIRTNGGVHTYRLGRLIDFANALSEIGAKEVFFDGRRDASAQPMTAETNKGKAMIMPVLVENISIEEDGRVVVGNSNTAFLYDLADKKPINDFAKKLGAKGVHIISDKEQLPSTEGSAYRAISSGSKIMGWYNPQTDQVYIYAPYAKEEQSVYETLLHEFVAHKGLRNMLGKENFEQLCQEVWEMMSEQDKIKYAIYIKKKVLLSGNALKYVIDNMSSSDKERLLNNHNLQLKSADEYMAHFAESGISEQNRNIWQRIADKVRYFLRKIGINIKLSNNDIAILLQESSRRLSKDMTMKEISSKIANINNVSRDVENNNSLTRTYDDIMAKVGTQLVEVDENTLVGLHNISQNKIRKAIKQGGLANPSAAVIDIAKQNHEGYGEITLVMPSKLVDIETGRNAGTYTGDAWTPTYPYVELQLTGKGRDKYYDTLREVFKNENVGIKNRMALVFENMLANQGNPEMLAYWYLLEKGIEPTKVIFNSGISDSVKERFATLRGKGSVGNLNAEERELLIELAAEIDGKTKEDLLQDAQESIKFLNISANSNDGWRRRMALASLADIEEYGVSSRILSDAFYKIDRAMIEDGKLDVERTVSNARNYVEEQGMLEDLNSWIENLRDRFIIKEVIFDGYDRNGNRKYVPNTLSNVSRLMNRESEQNAYSNTGLSATRAMLIERLETLEDIRNNKHRLVAQSEQEQEEWDQMQDKWFNDVIEPLSEMQKVDSNPFINNDIAALRLIEAVTKPNPIAYLNREYKYNIPLNGTYAKTLNEMIKQLKEMPTKYFETKFKRPVYLNEFSAAVVPQGLAKDIKTALQGFGMPLFEYDESVEGSRREATLKATELEGVRFRLSNNVNSETDPLVNDILSSLSEVIDENGVMYRIVTDPAKIAELEASEKIIGYRNVVLNEDGTFGSPMASSLRGEGQKVATNGFVLDQWEQAEENPDLADENGKITLVKPDGKEIRKVDYNPYIHNRPNKVNKQFKQAWERPNLVYIETEIAKTDLDEGYHAEKAKKSVGIHKWNGGKLILSRYDKPIRIVSWEEVADDWVKAFKKRGVEFDIVPPALLPILNERGIEILPPHKGMGEECRIAYQQWKTENRPTRSSITEEEDKAYADAVSRGDMETAHEMLRIAAERAGYATLADYRDAHGAPYASVDRVNFTNLDLIRDLVEEGYDANLWAIAQGVSMQPDDYFSPRGFRLYGYGNQSGMESYVALSNAIRSINWQIKEYGEVREMPKVTMYRAVPISILGTSFESEGQWISPSYDYVVRHGESRFGEGKYRIIEQNIPADQLWWDGNDIREWGFDDGTTNVYKNTENNRKIYDVTYDEEGNLIPLSKRFNDQEEDVMFRITSQEDAAYMDAVNRGDMEAAQRMVNEAAKKAMPNTKVVDENGNPSVVYHGTNSRFTVFDDRYRGTSSGDNGFFGRGFYFTFGNGSLSKAEAGYYGGRIMEAFVDVRNPFMFLETIYKTYNEKNGDANSYGGNVDESLAIINYVRNFPELLEGIDVKKVVLDEDYNRTYEGASLEDYVKEFEEVYNNKTFNVEEIGNGVIRVTADPQEMTSDGITWTDYGFSIDMVKPIEKADAQFVFTHYYMTDRDSNRNQYYSLPDIYVIHRIAESAEFADLLKKLGHDGVMQSAEGDEVVAFYPNQIKSADPVTYDDNGNVIPLSERFNEEDNDIRFKVYNPLEDHTLTRFAAKEMAEIKANAERNGTYLKAPNGADTNLTPRQWLQVRTRAFKKWFGNWENTPAQKAKRIEKLRKSEPVAVGREDYEGKYDLNANAAQQWIKDNLRSAYTNIDTGDIINLTKVGAEEVTSHSRYDLAHLKSISKISELIEKSIFITEENNSKGNNKFDSYRYYVAGVNIEGEEYTAKVVIGVKQGKKYYDHRLTQIEKTKLIDIINQPALGFTTEGNASLPPYSERKDTKLFSILQINSQENERFSQILDKNGEPMPVKHRTFAEFTEFDKEKIGSSTDFGAFGKGFYFSKRDYILYGWNLIEAFLNIKNPLLLNDGNAAQVKEQFEVEKDGVNMFTRDSAKAMSQWAIDNGYDGIVYETEYDFEAVAFEPNQIKSATENVGTFDEGSDDIRFRISNTNQRIFVSNAERAVESIKQEKATPQQWKAMIEKQGGLKAGEDKWLGLSEWLDSKVAPAQENETMGDVARRVAKNTITKQEILDYIAEHQIQIEEVEYAEGSPFEGDLTMEQEGNFNGFILEWEEIITGEGVSEEEAFETMVERYGDDFRMAFELDESNDFTYIVDYDGRLSDAAQHFLGKDNQNQISSVRLQYTTKGLEDKKEIALTVPTIESWNEEDEIHFGEAGGGRAIAWVRFGETTDADGNKVLVIDEIQSKRHQEGREKGYRDSKAYNALFEYRDYLSKKYPQGWNPRVMTSEEYDTLLKLNAEMVAARKGGGIPDAPFDKNWHELAFKRMLRYAAENGYDYVAWATGEQQAQRYNLGDVVDKIRTSEDFLDGTIKVDIDAKNTRGWTLYVTEDGTITNRGAHAQANNWAGKPLSDVVGKPMAEKILSNKNQTIEGENLMVGGEGMKGFYDKMLPSFVAKYTKKWGAKVQDINLPNLEESAQTMHAVNVTQEMKDSVMEGQVMFSVKNTAEDLQISPESSTFAEQYRWGDTMFDEDYISKAYSKEMDAFYDAVLTIEDPLNEAERNEAYIKKAKAVEEFLLKLNFSNKMYIISSFENMQDELENAGVAQDVIDLVIETEKELREVGKKSWGLKYNDQVFVFSEPMESLVEAQLTYAHELQHIENEKNKQLLADITNVTSPQELNDILLALGKAGYSHYLQEGADGFIGLADEVVAYMMEYGYSLGKDGNLADALKRDGLQNVELINLLQQEYERRKEDSPFILTRNKRSNSMRSNNGSGTSNDEADLRRRPIKVGEFKFGGFASRSMPQTKGELARRIVEQRDLQNLREEVANKLLSTSEVQFEDFVLEDDAFAPRFSITDAPAPTPTETKREYLKRYMAWLDAFETEKAKQEYKDAMAKLNGKVAKTAKRFVDKHAPVAAFIDWVRQQGGDVNITNDAYIDATMSLGRAGYQIRKFSEVQFQNLLDAIETIAKSKKLDGVDLVWQGMNDKEMNGKKLTPREMLGVFCQAVDVREAKAMGLPDRGEAGFKKNLTTSKGEELDYDKVISIVEKAVGDPMLRDLWFAIREATSFSLNYQLESGMIDKKTYDKFADRMFYVPERGWRERDMDGREDNYIKGHGSLNGSPYNPALQKAKGRESLAADPFAYIQSIAETTIMSAEKNKVKQKFLKMLMDNEMIGLESGAWRIKKAWVVDTGRTDADGNPIYEATYEQPKDGETIVSTVVPEGLMAHLTIGEKRQHRVMVVKDGQQYVIELESEEVANAINGNIAEAKSLGNGLADFSRAMTRYVSAINTQYNPAFAIWNLLRDFQTGLFSNLAENGAEFSKQFVKNIGLVQPAIWEYVKNDKIYGREAFLNTEIGRYLQEYFEMGAQTGYSFLRDIESLNKDIAVAIGERNQVKHAIGKAADKVADVFSIATEMSELSIRFAQFVTARQMGKSPEEAAHMAKEISVNFDRKGEWSGAIGAIYSFFNASIQGTNKFVRLWNHSKKARRVFSGICVAHILLGMLNTLLQPDDPEEEDWFSDYHRMTNFLIGDVKLPVAHFFRMFWALGVNMALSAQGRKTYKKAMFDTIDFAANELIPASLLQVNNFLEYNDVTGTIEIVPEKYFQGASPSWLSPITDVMLNRDYMGSTISKEPYIASDADHYKKLKYEKRNTAKEYQNAARILHLITGGDPDRLVKDYDGGLDINGSMIQHIAEGYSGGVGRTLFDAYISLASAIDPEREVEVKHVPVVNKMLKPYKEETAYNQEYWTLYKSLEHYKKYIKEGDADWKRRERQTERYDAYQDIKGLLNRKPEEGKQYSAEDVKKLMEANKRWRSVM